MSEMRVAFTPRAAASDCRYAASSKGAESLERVTSRTSRRSKAEPGSMGGGDEGCGGRVGGSGGGGDSDCTLKLLRNGDSWYQVSEDIQVAGSAIAVASSLTLPVVGPSYAQ